MSSLICHPQSAASAPAGLGDLSVTLAYTPDAIVVNTTCIVAATEIRLPPITAPGAADDLWRHTCCELFVGLRGQPGYREFNFSPSGQWAVYDFSGYRQHRDMDLPATPMIRFASAADGWTLTATIPAALLPANNLSELDFSLATVIEAADGRLSYWALAHPREKPDFHDRGGFILRGIQISRA